MDIYKCPKSIFGNTFGKQKPSFLYILTISLLKEQNPTLRVLIFIYISEMSTTVSNLLGTIGGTLAGTLVQYYKSGSIIDGINTFLEGETIKARTKFKSLFSDFEKETKEGSGRGVQLQHATVKQLIDELLYRQNGNYKKGKGTPEQTQFRKYKTDLYGNIMMDQDGKKVPDKKYNYYPDIAALIMCDPDKEYFIRNYKEFTEASDTADAANLYSIVVGTAVGSGITSGVGKLTEGLVQTGNGEYAADVLGGMAAPAFFAVGQTWVTKKITDMLKTTKETKYKERFQANPIDTKEQAAEHLQKNNEALAQLKIFDPNMYNSQKNKIIEDAAIQIITSENFANYIANEKLMQYEQNIAPKEERKNDLKTKIKDLDARIEESKRLGKTRTSRSATSQGIPNTQDTEFIRKLEADKAQLESERVALSEEINAENTSLKKNAFEQLNSENDLIDQIYTELTNVMENNPILNFEDKVIEKVQKIGTQIRTALAQRRSSMKISVPESLKNAASRAASKASRAASKASSAAREFMNRFTRKKSKLSSVSEERFDSSDSSDRFVGGSKTRKRRKSRKSTLSTFRKGSSNARAKY
jgi:hypothetical protein